MDITYTLDQRQTTHGDFSDNSHISQSLKRILKTGIKYGELSEVQTEALDMICHKMSRIVSGNPNESDHWHDIAGYAKLAEERIDLI